MKRLFCLILTFASVLALVSCGSKKKEDVPGYEEQVSKEIKAEEGGKVESSDGKTTIDIPAGALDTDTTITMTIYNAEGYAGTDGKKLISKVVEFEPSGTVFKKPVMISMASIGNAGLRATAKKVITAAVYREEKGEWSYSPTGVAVKVEYDASGDPIMTTAAGDPIMLNAAGDPIMQSDGSLLSAAGDPIMVTAAGDPIMQSAAGDPIMMTTGHFTAYAFLEVYVEDGQTESPDDAETPDDDDTDEVEDTDDSDTEETDEDVDTDTVEPEPEIQYSKVLCTNSTICYDEYGYQILCPKDDEVFYGQDAQYVSRKSCVPHHTFTEIPKPGVIENDFIEVHDSATGLTWLFTGDTGNFETLKNGCDISYNGKEDWRLPTPKEFLTLADNDGLMRESAADPFYFGALFGDYGVYFRSSVEGYSYDMGYGEIYLADSEDPSIAYFQLACVSGKEYGKVKADDYVSVTENDEEMIFDKSTNLYWQKGSAQVETWDEALSYCETLEYAGYTDWRLPNKNELITLIDYSKAGEEVVSSFPGMTPDVFLSSTGGYGPWLGSMGDGAVFPLVNSGGGEGELELKSVKKDAEEEEEEPPIFAKCVRSYLDEKKEGIPDCDETGVAPCKDANGTIWSSVIYIDRFGGFDPYDDIPIVNSNGNSKNTRSYYDLVYAAELASMCNTLEENGSHKWRLPTIDEIRGIVTSEKLKKGGSCKVATDCFEFTQNLFEESCFEEEKCTGDKPSKTLLSDYGVMLSGTFDLMDREDYETETSAKMWLVDLASGALERISEHDSISALQLVQRCVLDENIEYAEAPYTDPETGYIWSEISPSTMKFPQAVGYCASLSEEDPGHWWRLPTWEEIATLIRNCGEDDLCPYDISGKYSVFRDTESLWTIEKENSYVDFADLAFRWITSGSDYVYYRVRCVVNGEDPCVDDPCADVENATGTCSATSPTVYSCECTGSYEWYNGQCHKPLD